MKSIDVKVLYMKVLKKVLMLALLGMMTSVTDFYATDDKDDDSFFCCNIIIEMLKKRFEDPSLKLSSQAKMGEEQSSIMTYKNHLQCNVELDTIAWQTYPDEFHARVMAKDHWTISRLDELIKKGYSSFDAQKRINQEIKDEVHHKNIGYQKWVWDKTLIGNVSIPFPYQDNAKQE